MKSYIKFLSRNKLYAAIEAAGLIVSLAFVILIGSYVRHQWKVAHGAPAWKHYYEVSSSPNSLGITSLGLANLIRENVPGVELATMLRSQKVEGRVDDTPVSGNAWLAEPDFCAMFPVEWIQGNAEDLRGGSVAISESKARELSEGRDVIGLTLIDDNHKDTLTIRAVFRDIQEPILKFEADFLQLREFKTMEAAAFAGTSCLISSTLEEEKLKPALEALFTAHNISRWSRNSGLEFNGTLVRLDQMYFSDLSIPGRTNFKKGNLSLLRMLSAVVLLLLLSAVFNYINLSTALASRRVKEMGTRAILGASRREIVWRQLRESLVFTAVCMAFAMLLAHAFTPLLSHFADVRDRWGDVVSQSFVWKWDALSVGAVVLFTLLLGLLAGWIPTRIGSNYNLVQVVKGDYRLRSKRVFSKIFIVFQAALAVMLIAFALVLERQFNHMIHQPLGGNVTDLYVQDPVSEAHVDAVLRLPFVAEHGWAYGYPGGPGFTTTSSSKDGEVSKSMSYIMCDTAAFRMYQFDIVEDFNVPNRRGFWLSETAVQGLGADIAARVLPSEGNAWFQDAPFAGVVKDFALSDAAHVTPGGLGLVRISNSPEDKELILHITGDHAEAKQELDRLYNQFYMEQYGKEGRAHLNYFIEDRLREGLQEAEKYMRMIELFMILAVLVSQLGLLAMSAFFAGERTHDVAVRKVFGGTVEGEVARGVRAYMLLVGIACVLAVPAAVWISERYLQDFHYRISGYGWIFGVAVAIALAISFASVLWQTLKAARTNPAVELKKE